MIVCVCHNVSDRRIEHAVACGASCMKDLRDELGIGSACGKCAQQCRSILRQSPSANDRDLGFGAACAAA